MIVPESWQKEIDNNTEFGRKAAKVVAASKPATAKVASPSPTVVSDVGTLLLAAVQKSIGQSIQCGECLRYLKSLNFTTKHDHDKIVSKLVMHVPTPNDWRQRFKNTQERKQEYSRILNSIVPSVPETDPYDVSTIQQDSNWSVVLTTSYREKPTINECVRSMWDAGFDPIIFAEPNTDVPISIPMNKVIGSEARLGAWFNWLRSAKYALEETTANVIMTVQDDSLFHPDSKSFTESILWPSVKTGFISLYTAKHYSEVNDGVFRSVGVNRVTTSNLWGACALVFPRKVLQLIVDHPLSQNWTGVPPANASPPALKAILDKKNKEPWTIQNLDTLIGRILNAMQYEMYFVDPSPVKHISSVSAIAGHGSNSGRRNCIRCAAHDIPLKDQVFPNES